MECGTAPDGCGGSLDCGQCNDGLVCSQGRCAQPPVDCSGIAAHPSFELCESGPDHCAGVFTAGEGCAAYCSAAGLVCVERTGASPGCQQEPTNVLACLENNGHDSDWCRCERSSADPNCQPNPANPPVHAEIYYKDNSVTFDPRSSWVLTCRDYAYTAFYSEHEQCDSLYRSGSGRGMATFSFGSIPKGRYDVFIEGRHTVNRNPAGALVNVISGSVTYTAHINQRDNAGLVLDLHGRYCLEGDVTVIMDSSVSTASDSIRRVVLEPAP